MVKFLLLNECMISCPVASVLYREKKEEGRRKKEEGRRKKEEGISRGDSRITSTRKGTILDKCRYFHGFYTKDTNGHDMI